MFDWYHFQDRIRAWFCKRLTGGEHRWRENVPALYWVGRECRVCGIWESYPQPTTATATHITIYPRGWEPDR